VLKKPPAAFYGYRDVAGYLDTRVTAVQVGEGNDECKPLSGNVTHKLQPHTFAVRAQHAVASHVVSGPSDFGLDTAI